jgi:dTMP kinase
VAALIKPALGRGIDASRLQALDDWTLAGFKPDLTLLFDVSPEVAELRRAQARAADRFEKEQAAFFGRVREAYLQRARAEPERIRVIDAAHSIESIRAELDRVMEAL